MTEILRRFTLWLCGLVGIAVLPEGEATPQERTKPQWKFVFDFTDGNEYTGKDAHWEVVIEESNQWRARSLAMAQLNKLYPRANQIAEDVERVDPGRHIKRKRNRPVKSAPGYIYLIEGLPGHYKIGLTVDPKERIGTLGVQLPYPIRVIHLIPTENMKVAEGYLHDLFQDKRVRGEWFELNESEVAFIKGIEHLGSDLLQ